MTKESKIYIAVFILLLVVVFLAWWKWYAADDSVVPSETKQSYNSMRLQLERMVKTSSRMSMRVLGEMGDDAATDKILMLSYVPEGPTTFRVLFTGGVHGNEPAGSEALLRFATDLVEKKVAYPGVAFDIVPVVNPWGWIYGLRRNKDNRDLNRDFASFKTNESLNMQYLCKRTQYDIMVDLHEDSHVSGFYMYRLANPDGALCSNIVEELFEAKYPIYNGRVSKVFKSVHGVITCPLWSLRLARFARQLSMSNYFRLEGCPQVFLFETPRMMPLESRVAIHLHALKTLLEKSGK